MAYEKAEEKVAESRDGSEDTSIAASKNVISAFILIRVIAPIVEYRLYDKVGLLQNAEFPEIQWILVLSLLCAWLFRKHDETLLLTLAALNLLYKVCFGYSSMGAFTFAPFFLFAFAFVHLRNPGARLRDEAVLLIALIFLTAACQKMNSRFLLGDEFRMTSPLLSYLKFWKPDFELFRSEMTQRFMAYFTIAMEVFIGIGILLRPFLFANVVAFFILLLSLIHPPVIYVYFFFLPLLLLVPNGFPPLVARIFSHRSPWVPLLVAAVIEMTVLENAIQKMPFASWLLSATFLALHFENLFSRLTRIPIAESKVRVTRTIKTMIVPAVLLTVFAGSFWILPSPLGFNMFAARRFTIPFYTLSVDIPGACRFVQSKWKFSLTTDSSAELGDDGVCRIKFPTISGLNAIAKVMCAQYPSAKFQILNKITDDTIDCAKPEAP